MDRRRHILQVILVLLVTSILPAFSSDLSADNTLAGDGVLSTTQANALLGGIEFGAGIELHSVKANNQEYEICLEIDLNMLDLS